jgi:hypothetical protein
VGRQLTSPISLVDFIPLMTVVQFLRFLRNQYCRTIKIKTIAMGALLTRNGGMFPKHQKSAGSTIT